MRKEQADDAERAAWTRAMMDSAKSLYAREMHLVANDLAELSDGALAYLIYKMCKPEEARKVFGDDNGFDKLCILARATALSELVARANKKVEKL